MTTERDDTSFEPPHTASPTEHVLAELQLYGYRPFQDDPDPRPLPEARLVEGAVADIFDALVVALSDTRLEPDLEELLWSTVNLFHRASSRIERELDDNEQAQKRSQRYQDGSEIRSVELERLTAEGQTLIERRNCIEFFRDQAADQFERHTSSAWRPRSGSMVNHRTLTSAMIDSREFLAAKRRAETEVLVPAGPKIAVTGGLNFNDHHLIWVRLDRVYAKHPDMVLLHGGAPKGPERIGRVQVCHGSTKLKGFSVCLKTNRLNAASLSCTNQSRLFLTCTAESQSPSTGQSQLTTSWLRSSAFAQTIMRKDRPIATTNFWFRILDGSILQSPNIIDFANHQYASMLTTIIVG